MAEAILGSWRFDPGLILLVAVVAALYVRGWSRLHVEAPHKYTVERLAAYVCGLSALLLALESPLDAFGSLLLEAHMVQHLLLIVVAPPLLLWSQPALPILRGLPRTAFTDGLGPFLGWHGLQALGRRVTHPVVCWLAMAGTLVFWHMPRWYDLALSSSAWHEVEHSCFFYSAILFWWPVVGVWPGESRWPRWLMVPYLVLADVVNTGLSAWLVYSTRVVYRTYELAPRVAGISALDDQSTAGAIMWVPGSIALLIPAMILMMQALNGTRARRTDFPSRTVVPAGRRPFDLLRVPVIGRVMRWRYFRRTLQWILFAGAALIVADGLLGSQIAPLNLAGVLPWTYWRGFAVVILLAGGNFFCMACPFTLPRDLGRKLFPARLRWPTALRSKWLAAALLVIYLWAYEVFGLWNSPWWTAWIVIGYFTTAFVVDGFFAGASFCKYVCPIGQFHFVNSLVSPLEIKVRSAAVCGTCKTHDCIKGNAQQRGCELRLFQPRKTGNFDCTFCLDCVQACPQENVGIMASKPGSAPKTLLRRKDAAALAWVMTMGALVNAGAMVDPVMTGMHRIVAHFGLHSALPVTSALYLIGLCLVPLALVRKPEAREFAFALVPLGFSMWVAHFTYHLSTGWRSLFPVAARLLHLPFEIVQQAEIPSWLPSGQIILLDAGLVLSIYLAWRAARGRAGGGLRTVMPWAVLAICIWGASVWIVLQPMQMRGMVM
jgi:cytochrome c oxidase assembly factor CtaG/polyferredoxin